MPQLQPGLFFGQLFDGNPVTPSFLYYIYGLIFLAALAAGVYGYLFIRPHASHKVRRQYAELFSGIAIGLGAVGCILIILRFVGVPIISARILTYLWLVATVAFGLFTWFFYYRILPQRVHRYEQATLRLQFRPRAKSAKSGKKGHK
jgi:hypothetical protein